jgi:hypothetical protein
VAVLQILQKQQHIKKTALGLISKAVFDLKTHAKMTNP